ncbi:MAG: NTP transferase domain-containing protein [Rhodospirillaceae bacterium]|jgi:molybdenum cofactor cytidylyltransferase|nr:NTP transferase domain-containing protein [Rhodospirillaceae bacterium]MBT4488365.1 NTP transferase domain-containing protein [Rhodospirillaceae bacterium]MBT5897511.1 NTP transferase domain-containing protein [Rhodospirillaceae bacterium]MBT6426702.1 NTP transferase domain-containing protein [Rhodospirillaceae bacterium]MBT7760023.1 NTP transferase domain-containing protein [Rhodospirillaceae bacterium]
MIFGTTPLADAEGAILAHSVSAGGVRMKKGRYLSADDIKALAKAGVEDVIAARLEADDVDEDTAANAIAKACRGDGARLQAAFTGRCNLYADGPGVMVIDRERVDQINRIHEAVTIATLAPHEAVEAGQMLATIKIIPFAAPREAVERAIAIASGDVPLLHIAPYRARRAGLIMTTLAGTKAKVLDKTANVLRDRLERLGSTLLDEQRCPHAADDIAAAVKDQLDQGLDPILIFGASAITDRRDVVPAGIVEAGGTIKHFGMPVDPGNLLLLAEHDGRAVIGLPGCARSPKLNGFDWVLQRLLADQAVGPDDITAMGAGGLLKEIPTRPQLRAGTASIAPKAPRIAALILAAGQSRRMGVTNKLLAEIDGKAMLSRVVEAARASQVEHVMAVTGHEAEIVADALAKYDVPSVHNPAFAEGLSTSLHAGVAALPDDLDGVIVLLGDMPRITPGHIDRLIAAFNPVEGRAVCVPTYQGKRGNPVLFGSQFFAEMTTVGGDSGAKYLIGQHEDELVEVPMEDDAIFLDVDTPDALTAIRAAGVD